jgi:hypothetical protein
MAITQSKNPRSRKGPYSQTVVHVAMSNEMKEILENMAADDQRKLADFIRLLITAESKRRAAAQNGAAV